MLGFIFRCGRFFSNESSIMALYHSLVRRRLEYCTSVWSPLYANSIDQIERVQKKFSRMFFYKFNLTPQSYDKRLDGLKLHSLETRRLENDEITLFKLIHNYIDSQLCHKLSFDRRNTSTRSSNLFYLPKFGTNIERNSPLYRLQEHHDKFFPGLNIMDDKPLVFKKQVKNQFTF